VEVCKGVIVNRVLHSAQEERSRLELHPHASITLDHARLSVSYSQGITWVLTTDLGLLDGSLAEHLDATAQARHTNALIFAYLLAASTKRTSLPPTVRAESMTGCVHRQGFWFVAQGGRRGLLSSCDYKREDYVAAVKKTATLMAPLAFAQLSAEFRYANATVPE
jgi:hypothetical protein